MTIPARVRRDTIPPTMHRMVWFTNFSKHDGVALRSKQPTEALCLMVAALLEIPLHSVWVQPWTPETGPDIGFAAFVDAVYKPAVEDFHREAGLLVIDEDVHEKVTK